MDWSDHAMWWPEKNVWLDKTRWTLDQYNITADAVIHFTPMHKTLRVQLPDLRLIDCNVDFSVRTFNASIALCKELGEDNAYFHFRNGTTMCPFFRYPPPRRTVTVQTSRATPPQRELPGTNNSFPSKKK